MNPGDLVVVFPGSVGEDNVGIVVQCGPEEDEMGYRTWTQRARVLTPAGLNIYVFSELKRVATAG